MSGRTKTTASENKSVLPFDPKKPQWRIAGISLALALLVVGVFSQALRHQFVNYDDPLYVYENPHVATGLSLQNILWAFTHTHAENWHPLTWLSHMLDVQLYGLDPAGHHLTSVLLHALNAVLLFWLLRQMTQALWPSFFAAAFFALHPLRVESVAWIAERKDVLSGFFFFLTLIAYVHYARLPWSARRYALVFFLFACGLMAKPMLVTLPLVLLLLDYWPLDRLTPAKSEPAFRWKSWAIPRRLLLEKIPLFVLVLGSCFATVVAQQSALVSLGTIPFSLRLANALECYWIYLRQMIFPLHLAALYPYPLNSLQLLTALFSLLILMFISAAAWRLRRRHPYLLVGWLWYLLMLLPVIGVMQVGVQAHADRYTYLPQIGLVFALAWLATDATACRKHLRPVLSGAAVILLGGLASMAYVQTSFWRDSESLWNRALATTSQNGVAHHNLGVALTDAGRIDEALPHYLKAIEIQPNYVEAYNSLGAALEKKDRLEEAVACYQQALALDPRYAVVIHNLAYVFSRMGRLTEAETGFRKALELDPDSAIAHYNFANVLFEKEQWEEALFHYQKTLALNPRHGGAYYNLGHLFQKLGKNEEAATAFQRALEINPLDAESQNALGSVLHQSGRLDEAAAAYEKALKINPDFTDAHNNLAVLFFQAGRLDQALSHAQRAILLNPGFAPAYFNSGLVLEALGRPKEAIAHYEKALRIQTDYPEARAHLDLLLKPGKKRGR